MLFRASGSTVSVKMLRENQVWLRMCLCNISDIAPLQFRGSAITSRSTASDDSVLSRNASKEQRETLLPVGTGTLEPWDGGTLGRGSGMAEEWRNHHSFPSAGVFLVRRIIAVRLAELVFALRHRLVQTRHHVDARAIEQRWLDTSTLRA
jgi:hypothetical protein